MESSQNKLFAALKKLGVDVDGTVSRFMDDSEIYFKFLRDFPNEDRITPIREAVSDGDFDRIVQTAHKLKGVTANLGMKELSEAADVMVKKAKAGSSDDAEENLKRVTEINDVICKTIRDNT